MTARSFLTSEPARCERPGENPFSASRDQPGRFAQGPDEKQGFFGFVVGLEKEWGYFRLSELLSARGGLGLPIERDLYFTPRVFSQVREAEPI